MGTEREWKYRRLLALQAPSDEAERIIGELKEQDEFLEARLKKERPEFVKGLEKFEKGVAKERTKRVLSRMSPKKKKGEKERKEGEKSEAWEFVEIQEKYNRERFAALMEADLAAWDIDSFRKCIYKVRQSPWDLFFIDNHSIKDDDFELLEKASSQLLEDAKSFLSEIENATKNPSPLTLEKYIQDLLDLYSELPFPPYHSIALPRHFQTKVLPKFIDNPRQEEFNESAHRSAENILEFQGVFYEIMNYAYHLAGKELNRLYIPTFHESKELEDLFEYATVKGDIAKGEASKTDFLRCFNPFAISPGKIHWIAKSPKRGYNGPWKRRVIAYLDYFGLPETSWEYYSKAFFGIELSRFDKSHGKQRLEEWRGEMKDIKHALDNYARFI